MNEPEKGPTTTSPFRAKHWLALMGIMVLCIVSAVFYWSRFESFSVCFQCAHRQNLTAWEIPMIHQSLYESEQIVSTPLAEVIQRHGLIGDHDHEWVFAYGSGNGSPMVLGTSRSIGLALISPVTGEFIDTMVRYSGKPEAVAWLAAFNDGHRTKWCYSIANLLDGQSFTNAGEFDFWLEKAMDEKRYLNPRAAALSQDTSAVQ